MSTYWNDLLIEERLWGRLNVTSSGCWEWTGAPNGVFGYGRIRFNGRRVLTHRLAWELSYGSVPGGLFVLHHCDNPPCCKPEHLFLGDNFDNMADKVAKGRHHAQKVTHCPANHLYDDANTYINARGHRECQTCRSGAYARRVARSAA